MSNWDYELAKKMKSSKPSTASPPILEGVVARVSPLTVSLCGGEVMAPPLPLDAVVGAQGLYRDAKSGSLYLETWKAGDRVCCALMGGTVVVLGRIGGTNWTIPER